MTQADNKKIFYILCFTIIDGHLHELRVSYQLQKLLTLHEHMSSYPSRAPEFLPFASTWVLTLHEHPSSYPSRTHEFLPFTSTWVLTLREHLSSPRLLVESVLLIFLVFCVAFLILFVFVLYLVYPILLVSLDCPFLISPSVFSNVYLKW
jgi:hypothetical protein